MKAENALLPNLARAIVDNAGFNVSNPENNHGQVRGSPKGANEASTPMEVERLIGPFSLRVLASIQRLGDCAWGSNLQRDLSEMLGRDVAIGQLYLALSKLVDQKLISFRHTEPEPVQGGRSKKIFQLEVLGAQVLGNAAAQLSA